MIKDILIALCGMSPAVITETLYALLQIENPIIPDELIVITTSKGCESINQQLFANNTFDRFKKIYQIPKDKIKFGCCSKCIRIIPGSDFNSDSDDIITDQDSNSTADFILSALREYTENPDTRIIFSIAGGRKTMSVLGGMAMSLLGRRQDILCHVLVNPPFDSPNLKPKFYFPSDKIYITTDNSEISDKEAVITLSQIPFIKYRYLFQKTYGRLPGNFLDMVNDANDRIKNIITPPTVRMLPENMKCYVNGKSISFNPSEYILLWLLLHRSLKCLPEIIGQRQLLEEIQSFVKMIPSELMPEIINHKGFMGKTHENIRNIVYTYNKKIIKDILVEEGRDYLIPNKKQGIYRIVLNSDCIDIPVFL